MSPIISIIILVLTVLFGGAVIIYLQIQKKKANTLNIDQQTAQDMINVKDIRNNFLYTKNGLIMMYLRINPINKDLFSKREEKLLTRRLSAQFSGDRKPFKFIAVSRSTDISPMLSDYEQKRSSSTDSVRKYLLKEEMSALADFSLSGDAIERRFYFCIWQRFNDVAEKEITKRMNEFVSRFQSAGISVEIAHEREIAQLINLIHNPAYTQLEYIEEHSFKYTIPYLVQN